MPGDDHLTDYTQITDNIFIGSDLCKGMSCPIHGADFEKLGILVELNLSVEKKETPPDGIDIYSWIPVPNGYAPTTSQFDIGTSIINEAVMHDKKVYVHCKNGHGRSPLMVAAYFIRFMGKSVDESEDLIKAKRAEIHFEENQRESLNQYYQKCLK